MRMRWLVVGVVGLFGLMLLFAPYYSTQLWWLFRQQWFWLVPLLVLAVMALGAAALGVNGSYSAATGLGLITVAGAVGFIGWLYAHEYQQDRWYAQSIHTTTDPVPGLVQRPPFDVSERQVRPNLGDIPGDIQTTMYLPDLGVFTTPVERRGTFEGYQSVLSQQIGDTGRNTPTRCDFGPAAGRRLGGLFTHSLERLINTERRWVNWDTGDAYAWCDNTTPMIAVPLKEQDGWVIVTERPAGIAVYNGATGALDVRPNGQGIPGPTYPLSLAADQRESSGALTGFWDWVWNRAGWKLPDETDAINSGNNAEFVLNTTGGDPVYATLLTGRGSATAVSAIAVVPATLDRGDALQPVTVHRTNPVWLSPGSILDRIRADFGDVFATQRDAQVFELAPLGRNRWTATIGQPQNILYRVQGDGDLKESPCLLALDGRQLRCGPAVNVSGAGPGVALGGATGSVAPVPAGSDLTGLTPDQLTDLNRRVVEELGRRVGAGGR